MPYLRVVAVALSLLWFGGCQTLSPSKHTAASIQSTSAIIRIQMKTTLGTIEVELYQNLAPKTVGNFLRYVDNGQYNSGNFYRVVRYDNDQGSPKITVIQGDVADTDLQFAPIKMETTTKTTIKHLDGTLSMARMGPDTATSSFFICIGAQPGLDHGGLRNPDKFGYAAFGRVVKGMEIVRQINQISQTNPAEDPYMNGQMLTKPVVIESITRM